MCGHLDDLWLPEETHSEVRLFDRTSNKKTQKPIMKITITNEQQVQVTLTPVTQGGQPAQLDGVPTWEVISGNSTILVAEDGKSAILRSADDPGDTEILIKADADLGAGVVEVSDVIQLTVAGAMAASLGLTVGEPSPKI